MSDLLKRTATALRPFAADVYRAAGDGKFSLTVTAAVVHEAREAVRAYDERVPQAEKVDVKINLFDLPELKVLVEKLDPLLVLCGNEPKGSKIERALREVDATFTKLRGATDGE